MSDNLVLKRKKLQIDSDEGSGDENNNDIVIKQVQQQTEKEEQQQNQKDHSKDKNEQLNGRKKEHNNGETKRIDKKEEKSQEKQEQKIKNQQKNHEQSEEERKIDQLFEPDHTNSMDEIEQLRAEIQEEKKEQELKEQKRRERKQREREEREQRDREREERKKNQKQKSQVVLTSGSNKDPSNLSKKDKLIYEVLRRWWYALPPWPPVDYNFQEKLNKLGLRAYDYKNFRNAKDVDENGLKKVYHIEGFNGLYKDQEGKLIDLRPVEGKPCYSEFKKKSDQELKDLLKLALTEQIKQLEQYLIDSDDKDRTYLDSLQKQLKRLN